MSATCRGICFLNWDPVSVQESQQSEDSPEKEDEIQDHLARGQRWLSVFFNSADPGPPPTLDLARYVQSEFALTIYNALLTTRRGTTLSYGELAALAGRWGAAQAVGTAMSRNPLPIFIPCHRVIAANGGPGGFSGGLKRKVQLLSLEGNGLFSSVNMTRQNRVESESISKTNSLSRSRAK
ncbi:MAG: MGMT family protein [bacterium]|nr:MGMT family protein [bacterium]